MTEPLTLMQLAGVVLGIFLVVALGMLWIELRQLQDRVTHDDHGEDR